jgi:hypothetical protein
MVGKSIFQRFAPPGLREGSFRICRAAPGGAGVGAAPIVNSVPPPGAPVEVDGASWPGALKGEEGDEAPKAAPLEDPKPLVVGRALLPAAGDAGWEPNEKGAAGTAGNGAPKEKGDD